MEQYLYYLSFAILPLIYYFINDAKIRKLEKKIKDLSLKEREELRVNIIDDIDMNIQYEDMPGNLIEEIIKEEEQKNKE